MCVIYTGTAFARTKAWASWETGKAFPNMGQALKLLVFFLLPADLLLANLLLTSYVLT